MNSDKKMKTALFFLLLLSLGSWLTGCTKMEPARTTAEMAGESVLPLVLAAGDVVDVKFFYVPELDESQIIRPDGVMTLQLVGDVKAEGMSPAQLHKELLRRYATQLKNPNITVVVRRVNDSRIWVAGEVKRPGPVQMTGRLTVLEAVFDVGGGIRPMADMKNVLVVRQREGKSYGCLVNLKEVLQGKERAVFFLQPRDVVYVPPTKVTQVNDWIDQYINKMVPQTRTIATYPIGPGGAGQLGIDTTNR